MIRRTLLALLTAAAAFSQPKVEISKTAEGIRFGYLGVKPSSPRPVVFFLGGAVEDSLTLPHYLQAVETLGDRVLCVTLDLPAHGESRVPAEPGSLEGWRSRVDGGQDIAGDLTSRARRVLDHLVREGFADPLKIAAFGTSRGGFLSLHFAAAEPRVRHVAAFAPVTNLLVLREFWGMMDPNRARRIAASTLVNAIHDRGLWMTIGGTDDRVGTGDAMDFALRFIEAARSHGKQPNLDLHVQPTEGHRVPEGSYRLAAQWLLKQWGM